ncbi:MAG: DUF4007 family protein [Gammaproteobacteria bacterium]|nr:DUF4007 family protein [Gammaproteobacteria bacterium]
MQLDSKSGAFGRHESFPLRFGWITKGLEAIAEYPDAFSREDATVILGVGKNMVASIKYWLLAAQIVQLDRGTKTLAPSSFAKVVFDDHGDLYLEDEATIWLLHWLLATNAIQATSIYWFFNHFHKRSFDSADVVTGLTDFVKHEFGSNVSQTTLKRDAQLVLRMYSKTSSNPRVSMEDSMDSPLALLNLLERNDSKSWQSSPLDRSELPLEVLAFAIAQLFEHGQINQLAVTDLLYSDKVHCAPGAVFRLTEEGLVEKLEELCTVYSKTLQLDRTAGVFQLYKLESLDPLDILRSRYTSVERKVA